MLLLHSSYPSSCIATSPRARLACDGEPKKKSSSARASLSVAQRGAQRVRTSAHSRPVLFRRTRADFSPGSCSAQQVNFSYVEERQKKQALVKLRLCPHCSDKLSPSLRKRRKQRTQVCVPASLAMCSMISRLLRSDGGRASANAVDSGRPRHTDSAARPDGLPRGRPRRPRFHGHSLTFDALTAGYPHELSTRPAGLGTKE